MKPTYEHLHRLLEYRDGQLIWKLDRPRARAGTAAGKTVNGYKVLHIGTEYIGIHRVIWFMHHGHWPTMIDHKDGDRANNRLENLREATSSQNNANRRVRKPSRYRHKGVIKWHNRWRATASVKGKPVYLGLYKTEAAAAIAVNNYLTSHFGEFAIPNNVTEEECDAALKTLHELSLSA